MTSLVRHVEQLDRSPAGAALAAFADRADAAETAPVGFCHRPADAGWFRLDPAGVPRGRDGRALDLTGVFELRAFSDRRELRWHHDSGGEGTPVVVSDRPAAAAADGPTRADTPYGRLLWGRATAAPADGWVRLVDARIGSLDVPLPPGGAVPLPAQVWLHAVEYHAVDDHGNVSIIDERLTGLALAPPAGPEQGGAV